MHIFEHYPYNGRVGRFAVPEGVTEALFECWGAAGGMPSWLHHTGKKRQTVGGTAPPNHYFTNSPNHEPHLGHSFSNNAGYAAGSMSVTPGDVYHVYVGGNGLPGHSTIRLQHTGSIVIGVRGGAGGWNGGGDGGNGAHIHQNLYESSSNKVHFRRKSMPHTAKTGQTWYDTDAHVVKKCTSGYKDGGTAAKWKVVSHTHHDAVGPSGGGGGGATDIRYEGTDLSDRILVAGGSGGSGGPHNKTGKAAWTLRSLPASPKPPFGSDTAGTGPHGPDSTWSTNVNYLVGGWGRGGVGGGGPVPSLHPTADGGRVSFGAAGTASTARHHDAHAPHAVPGSGGGGGTNDSGGSRGSGGGHGGSLGAGGDGARAAGGYDDWCAGGGGGGGGYYGGGGGGEGFKVTGENSSIHTRGGGGGGGANYASPLFTSHTLAGSARPPVEANRSGSGANGHGGFARISYHKPPMLKWAKVPTVALASAAFTAGFTYTPAKTSGAGISHYETGVGASTASAPSVSDTHMAVDPTQTGFEVSFNAPTIGATSAYFVRVTDLDGDSSGWLKQTITGVAAAATTTATITSPAHDEQFIDTATVRWTLDSQTPLAAYRLGLSGVGMITPTPTVVESGFRRGGSRVNLAADPGFETSAVWGSDANTALAPTTASPGVSGHSGVINWAFADEGDAENHTVTLNTLMPGVAYRLHLEVASALDNDPRPPVVQVWDDDGLLTEHTPDLSGSPAGVYVPMDIAFTPHTQSVYFSVVPSSLTVIDPDDDGTGALVNLDFEGNTISPFTSGTVNSANPNTGDYCLSVNTTTATTSDLSASLTDGAGYYVLEAWTFAPTAGPAGKVAVGGTGATATAAAATAKNVWTKVRVPFFWDGAGTVTLAASGNATYPVLYDDITVWAADPGLLDFGNADSGQVTNLANMLIELAYEEDSAGLGTYFDGSHANGNTGAVSWSSTANGSPSYIKGTDVTSGDIVYSGSLLDGQVFLTTFTESALVSGYEGSYTSQDVAINPSIPDTPAVALVMSSPAGTATLNINADDGSAAHATVSFDIFRDGVRIVTGLTPDQTTRKATYIDFPATGDTPVYSVRAFDAEGGYTDQASGTVTVVD